MSICFQLSNSHIIHKINYVIYILIFLRFRFIAVGTIERLCHWNYSILFSAGNNLETYKTKICIGVDGRAVAKLASELYPEQDAPLSV